MSQTFTLQGTSHELSCTYHPPIELEREASYSLGLIGFRTYNTIPNIEHGTNKFYYDSKVVTIPDGSYEIEDIEKYLKAELGEKDDEKLISLSPNNNTLQCNLRCKYAVDFRRKDSIGSLLGFSPRVLKANENHFSDLPVNIIKVSSVRIECNVVTGAYYGSRLSHTLFEFSPDVNPGYAINIVPSNVVYLPITVKTIDNITLKILDQRGHPVNFRGEPVLIRLQLKKDGI